MGVSTVSRRLEAGRAGVAIERLQAGRPVRLLFAGGGSGGHLRPGLDVARSVLEAAPDSEVRFAVTDKPLDSDLVGAFGMPFEAVPAPRIRWTASGVARAVTDLGRGLYASGRLLARWRPDLVVALGGHGCVAPGIAARLRGVRLALLEQNRAPGRASRLLAASARVVFAPFEESRREFPRPVCVEVLGNPVRADLVFPGGAAEARRCLGLASSTPTLLIVGGSQGAAGLNARVAAALHARTASAAPFQAIHLAGTKEAALELEAAYGSANVAARVMTFTMEMPLLYAAADLVLARAGGTTLAELLALGKPAVLVPYPHHRDRHQERNAEVASLNGAARVVQEFDLGPAAFDDRVLGLLRAPAQLDEMARKSRRLGRPDAARRVAARLLEIAAEAGLSAGSGRR